MYKYLLVIVLFLVMVPTAYAQGPICTDPDGPAKWEPAGALGSPKWKFRAAQTANHILIPDGPAVHRMQLIPGNPPTQDTDLDLPPGGRTDGDLHVVGNRAYLSGGNPPTVTVMMAHFQPNGHFGEWVETSSHISATVEHTLLHNNSYLFRLGYYPELAPINPNGSLGAWEPTTWPEYRMGYGSLMTNKALYIAGGMPELGRWTLRSVKYTLLVDDKPGTWVTGPSLNLERYGAELTLVGNWLYIIGGDDLVDDEIGGYDTIERVRVNANGSLSGQWEFVTTRLRFARREFGLARDGNIVYALGGTQTEPNHTAVATDSIEAADLSQPSPPPDYGFSVNDGALFTNDINVILTIGVSYPFTQQMQISNDGGFAGATWTDYTPCQAWTITEYGSYTIPRVVYVRYKSAGGAISPTFSDDIILDVNAPGGSVAIVGGETLAAQQGPIVVQDFGFIYYLPLVISPYVPPPNVVLALTANDDVSGVAKMQISNRPDFLDAAWQPFSNRKSWYLPAGGTVYARFQDWAGNISATVSDQR